MPTTGAICSASFSACSTFGTSSAAMIGFSHGFRLSKTSGSGENLNFNDSTGAFRRGRICARADGYSSSRWWICSVFFNWAAVARGRAFCAQTTALVKSPVSASAMPRISKTTAGCCRTGRWRGRRAPRPFLHREAPTGWRLPRQIVGAAGENLIVVGRHAPGGAASSDTVGIATLLKIYFCPFDVRPGILRIEMVGDIEVLEGFVIPAQVGQFDAHGIMQPGVIGTQFDGFTVFIQRLGRAVPACQGCCRGCCAIDSVSRSNSSACR